MHLIRVMRSLFIYLGFLALSACGGGGGDSNTPATFTIGGTVSGLSGSGLVLQNNGGGNLGISASGTFTFSGSVTSGGAYSVSVLSQPTSPTQTCTVTNALGTASANVTNVAVNCATNSYRTGGTISGLSGSGLVLQNNAGDNLTVAPSDTTFTFATSTASGGTYAVTVLTQPASPSQTCSVIGGSGTTASVDISNVAITCVTNSYTVGGTISGLSGSITLRKNGSGDLTISSNGTYSFPAAESGTTYSVIVSAHPTGPNQTCTVTNPSGTIGGATVTNVNVACSTNSYTLGGTVSGLSGSGLALNDGSGHTVNVSSGSFTFGTSLASGSPYTVSVSAQPSGPTQTCTVANASGTISAANINNVAITCTTNTYTIGGTVSGLAGSGLVLHNNTGGGSDLNIVSNGSFTFSSPLASGTTYTVTVGTQPATPAQNCTVSNPSGTITGQNVSNISISCTTNTYTIGGSVSGLAGAGLVLHSSVGSGSDLPISANGAFNFPASPSGSAYTIIVSTQPTVPSQTCAVTNDTGTVGGANVTNVSISCSTNTYTIGGSVSGLAGAGLVLHSSVGSGSDLPISANGAFNFPASPSGSAYTITVGTQPAVPSQTCTVTNDTGTVGGTNITNVSISCSTNTYTVGGTVSGLIGTGLVLQNNGGGDLPISADGAFNFPSQLSGSVYAVTVLTQPGSPSQTCTVANSSGTVSSANVINVTIACTTRYAYVANRGSDNISTFIVDAATGALTPVTGGPFATTATPQSVKIDPTGKFLYVASGGVSNNVTAYAINSATGALTAVGSPLPAGTNAHNVTIDPSGKFAYVANNGADTVSAYAINATTGALTELTNSPFATDSMPRSVVIDPSGKFAYVVCSGTGISAYTIASNGDLAPIATFALSAPWSMAIDPSGKFAYAGRNDGSNNITAYSINTDGTLAELTNSPFAAGAFPGWLTIDSSGKFAYVVDSSPQQEVAAYSINAVTGDLSPAGVGPFATGQNPEWITIDSSGKFVYVVNYDTGDVSAYTVNSATGALTPVVGAPFTVGTGPVSVAITP